MQDCLEFSLPSLDSMSADLVDVSFVGSSVSISASSPNGLIYFIANASHTNQIQTSAQLLLRDGQQITMISVGKVGLPL